MPEIEKVEYEFPDEKEAKSEEVEQKAAPKSEEPDIEVVDDTPEQDRGREPMETAPEDPSEDELQQYSESVRKRIQKFSRGYHDERRRAEAALREREEALRLAKAMMDENNRLKGSLNKGQEALINQAKAAIELEIEKAKRKYKEAYDAGDSDALVAAQDELTAAKIKADRINSFKPTPLQKEESVVERQQNVPAPRVDSKALAWKDENRWFGSDDEMTSFALGLHTKLVKSGVDPQSDEYYEKIDSRMRQVFPDAFDSPDDTDRVKPSRAAKSSVVAPATRSTASKKIVLTQSQVNIAKRLGVPLDAYAKQVAEQARKQNG
ncbi:MAG: hypothetical protein ACO22O_16145 [bacterium]